uniref:Uncharacterized protein n=1 Tax=Anguilla anguilla TaxID=7936 RepID=A0A0E9TMX1_ANGAN
MPKICCGATSLAILGKTASGCHYHYTPPQA